MPEDRKTPAPDAAPQPGPCPEAAYTTSVSETCDKQQAHNQRVEVPGAPQGAHMGAQGGWAMDDDLNAPEAMAAMFDYVNKLYAAGVESRTDAADLLPAYRCLTAHLAVFGVEVARPELYPELCVDYAVTPTTAAAAGRGGDGVVDKLLTMRTEARKAKDFAKGDMIRKLLIEAGVEVEDSPQGTRWSAK